MIFHWSLSDSKSPGLLSVFWPISTMIEFELSSLVLLFPCPPVPVRILSWLYRTFQTQLVLSLSSSLVFFSSLARFKYISLFSLSFSLTLWSAGTAKSTICRLSFFFKYWLSLGLIVYLRLGDLFVSQNHWEFCVSYIVGRILGCALLLANSLLHH